MVDSPLRSVPLEPRTTGTLPSQTLHRMIDAGQIAADAPIEAGQVQPASLDLRLGAVANRVLASFLPGTAMTVADKLEHMAMHALDLAQGAVLERDCVYIIPLMERVAFPAGLSAIASPKSSTGRLDIFCRLITDRGVEFDRVPDGYAGPLYVEVCPRAFSAKVRTGSRLMQMRVRRGSATLDDAALGDLQRRVGLVGQQGLENIKNGIAFTADVRGSGPGAVVGYRARRNAGLIDVDKVGHYAAAEFWEEIQAPGHGRGIVLDPHDFYILASKEAVTIPASYAAEMLAYDTLVGEFRVHYAGFFDPGFGDPEMGASGTRAVLEIRAHEVPFLIEDGQVVGRLVYEPLTERPDKLYGQGIGSSYQRQGLVLGKHFRR